jgi:hypothetical protein
MQSAQIQDLAFANHSIMTKIEGLELIRTAGGPEWQAVAVEANNKDFVPFDTVVNNGVATIDQFQCSFKRAGKDIVTIRDSVKECSNIIVLQILPLLLEVDGESQESQDIVRGAALRVAMSPVSTKHLRSVW